MKSALNWAVHVDLSLRFSSTSSSTNAKLARWFPSSVLARCRLRFTQQSVLGVPPSATVTAERVKTEKAQRSTKVARLSALKFVPRVGSILWVDLVDLQLNPRQDPASLHLWTSSAGCRDRHTSGRTPSV